MKKLIIFLVIAVLVAGTISAQPIRDQRNSGSGEKPEQLNDATRQQRGSRSEVRSVTVEGVLKLEKGFVAVESADKVYVVPMLNRYIGFISGLREGEKVSVEGYEFRSMIRPTKVTIDGKSYDFIAWNHGQGPKHGFGKRDFRPDNNRRIPSPRGDNQGRRNRDKKQQTD
ncbi:hypothetical protein R84B8_00197 [Treponema sp. R8-4-B8]